MAFSIEDALEAFFNNSGGGGVQYGGTGQGRQLTGSPTGGSSKGGSAGSGYVGDKYPACGGTHHVGKTQKLPNTWNRDTSKWDSNSWNVSKVEYPDGSSYTHPGPVSYKEAPAYCYINSKGYANWAWPYYWDFLP